MRCSAALLSVGLLVTTLNADAKEPPSAYAIPVADFEMCHSQANALLEFQALQKQGASNDEVKNRLEQSNFNPSTRASMWRALMVFEFNGPMRIKDFFVRDCVYSKLRPSGGGWID